MHRGLRVTLVIPCLNEERGIRLVLGRVPPLVDETVVVDNGSTDGTARVARELGATVVEEPRRGYGRALKSGFDRVETGIIVTLDGDGTYPCECIGPMVDALLDGPYDFLSGRRFTVTHELSLSKLQRYCGNLTLTAVFGLLFGRCLRDSQSGMWAFHRRALEGMRLGSDGMAFSEEIKIEAFSRDGLRAGEYPIPYSHSARRGRSKLRLWRDGLGNLSYLFRKKREMRRRRPGD